MREEYSLQTGRNHHLRFTFHVSRFTHYAPRIMNRRVEPELLDQLPSDDPGAAGARLDLRRLNVWMGHTAIAERALRSTGRGPARCRILELGAGDGTFLLSLATRLSKDWPETDATLLDRQNIVRPDTRLAFEKAGWRSEILTVDLLDWLRQPDARPWDVIMANLFLHQFSDAQLTELLPVIARRTRVMIAVEPRRSAWTVLSSRLVGLAGCNRVTRHDAVVSAQAGFADHELSRFWPDDGNWSLQERSAGWFSHLFIARMERPVQGGGEDLK
jgi:hypothetical protein